jgi:hypothetical protein
MDLSKLHITKSEFNLFCILSNREKIQFFWDCQFTDKDISLMPYDAGVDTQNNEIAHHDDTNNVDTMMQQEIIIGPERMLVTSINGFYYLNATRLFMIRGYVRNLTFNRGIVLLRVHAARKTEYDPYKYFMCYECIGQSNPISPN